MATIIEHKLKNGKSYTIQVKINGKFVSTTIKEPKNMRQAEITRYINRMAAEFEDKVRTSPTEIKKRHYF